MEINKKEKVLSTLVDFVGKEEDFSFKELDIIVQEVTPESKNNIILSQDLKECFGESIVFRREPSPRGHGSRIIFKFKDDTNLLKKKINQYSLKKKYRLKKEIAINVYEYLEFLPGIDSEYDGKIPDINLINKYSEILAGEKINIDSDKFGRYKNKRLRTENNFLFLKKYRNGFEKIFGESLKYDDDIINEIIPHKDIPEILLSKLRNINDRDYNISILILNMMILQKKASVIVSDVFNELKKNGINCTGLNFSEWCRENPHFNYCNYQIRLKGDYCEIINKKPILSKKEGTGTEVKKENEEIFYIISPDNLKETKNISFNKEIENLKIYKITVDYYDVFSILNAYNLIIKYTVLGDEIIAKVTRLVKESIAEKIERKI